MNLKNVRLRPILSLGIVFAILLTPYNGISQLISYSSITGGSSVFVFRNSGNAPRRPVVPVRPPKTKEQQLDTARRIKKQYETIARTMPKVNRAKSVDPDKLPKNVRTLPAAEGSKLFAGVGEYYNDQGDYEKAMEFFRDAVSLDESNSQAKAGFSEALALKGNDLLVKDQASAAKGVFLEALKLDPKNSAAHFGLGEVYAQLDQTEDAIAAYEKSLENNKDLTEIYVPLGILYYQSREIAKADSLLTKALAIAPNSAETQFFLGLVRSTQNRNDEALAAFQKAKELDPTLAEAFFHAGEMLVRLKRTADAVPEFRKAVDIKPGLFDAWFSLGDTYLELGNIPEAINAFKAAAKLKNNDWEVFSRLGEAYRQNKEFELAEANYNLASIFLANSKEPNKEALADLFSKVGLSVGQQCDINIQKNVVCKWPVAIRALTKAAELTDNPIDHVNLGWAYFRLGHQDFEAKNMTAAKPNLELAITSLKRAAASGPPASEYALQNMAAAQIDLGDYQSAIGTLTQLIAIRPDLTFSRYALGVAYNKSGDLANAEKWLREAVDREPENLAYLTALAETLITRKNGKEAKKIVERIRPLNPQLAANMDLRIKLAKL